MLNWVTLSEQFLQLVKVYIPNFTQTIMPAHEYKMLRQLIQKKITQQSIKRDHFIAKQKDILPGSIVKFEGKSYNVKKVTKNGKVHLAGRRYGCVVSPLSCEIVNKPIN